MNILTELYMEGRIYSCSSVIIEPLMGRNKSFFSLLGLWETFSSLGDSADALGGFGKLWGGFGRLWGCFGDALGGFGEALGGFGRLWEALGGFGEALGGFGDARRPPPSNKNNYIQKCWEYANSR